MIKSYIINLDKDVARMNHMHTQFKELGLIYERISAYDGHTLSEDEIQAFSAKRITPHIWLPGQIGCFHSHFNAWKKIAEGSEENAAIFEDDLHFAKTMASALASSTWLPKDFDIVRLEASTNRLLLEKKASTQIANRSIHLLHSTSWCAGAYIISRETARRIITTPESQQHPTDSFLFCRETSPIARGLTIYQTVPVLAIQNKFLKTGSDGNMFPSNIEKQQQPLPRSTRLITLTRKVKFSSLIRTIQGYKHIPFISE